MFRRSFFHRMDYTLLYVYKMQNHRCLNKERDASLNRLLLTRLRSKLPMNVLGYISLGRRGSLSRRLQFGRLTKRLLWSSGE